MQSNAKCKKNLHICHEYFAIHGNSIGVMFQPFFREWHVNQINACKYKGEMIGVLGLLYSCNFREFSYRFAVRYLVEKS